MRGTTRLTAYAATTVLALSGTLLTISPAQAVPHDTVAQTQGADWLEGELTNGLMHNPNYGGFDDYGLSIDTAFALAAVGGHDDAVSDVADALAGNIDTYTKAGNHVYAGGLAKLGVLADLDGDATSFGTRNLVTEIEGRVATAAPIAGRLEDAGFTPGDQFDDDAANTLGQSYAAHVLTEHSSAKAADATAFLLEQQCSDGYFRLSFTADKTDTDQSCVNGTDPEDTDATAIAILQLEGNGATGVSAAVADAKAWLVDTQKPDGSWGGGPSTEGSNANSTGLAAWALGNTPESEQAAEWLRDHQATPLDYCNQLGPFTGAISYNDAGRTAGRTGGITAASSDEWRRATAQAVFALDYLPAQASGPLTLTGPSGFRKAGGAPVLTTAGAPAGTQLCLTGVGTKIRRTPASAPWNIAVTLPAGTANRVYTVRDAYGHVDSATVRVLGKKTLDLRTSTYRVKRSGQVTAVLRGLTPGESASIYYRGKVVGKGTASSLGRLSAKFKAVRVLGKHTIFGYGQFHDIRRDTAVIKVVR